MFGTKTNTYAVAVFDAATQSYVTEFWPDNTGTLRMTMKEGYYYLQLMELDLYTGSKTDYIYTNNGWELQTTGDPTVYVTPGVKTELHNFE